MKVNTLLGLFLVTLLMVVACRKMAPPEPEENELLDGPMEGLSKEQRRIFVEGDEAFGEVFGKEEGLGPIFVSNSCASCHPGDGKGHPSTTLTRFNAEGGPQLQNRSIPGFEAEKLPSGTPSVEFTPPSITGLGFVAALHDSTLLNLADEQAANGVVSGEVQYITPPSYFEPKDIHIPKGGQYIGRFGKKAAAIDLRHQVVTAYNQDMGITSDYAMEDPVNHALSEDPVDPVGDPEIPAATVNAVVFYVRTLKKPPRREENEQEVLQGEQLFTDAGCGRCHKATLKTARSDVQALSEKTFHPYSDFLLHDMGPALDAGVSEGSEQTSEYRTAPLWGLGLAPKAQGEQVFLMHDGRAHSIREAIQMHDGEAAFSRSNFQSLSGHEQAQLIRFLKSL